MGQLIKKGEQYTVLNETMKAMRALEPVERKLFVAIVTYALKEPKWGDHTIEIPPSEIKRLVGLSMYSEFKKALKGIAQTTMEFEIPNQEYFVASLISQGHYKNGRIFVKLPTDLRPAYEDQEKLFSSFLTGNLHKLRTSQSITFFEEMNAFKAIGSRVMKVQTLRDLLDPTGRYEDWYRFRNKSLLPAMRAVNKHTQLTITDRSIKKGRNVVSIEFFISETPCIEAEAEEVEEEKEAVDTTEQTPTPLCEELRKVAFLPEITDAVLKRWRISLTSVELKYIAEFNYPQREILAPYLRDHFAISMIAPLSYFKNKETWSYIVNKALKHTYDEEIHGTKEWNKKMRSLLIGPEDQEKYKAEFSQLDDAQRGEIKRWEEFACTCAQVHIDMKLGRKKEELSHEQPDLI